MWKNVNPNPCGCYVGDCVVRALSIAMNVSWEQMYLELCKKGFEECDMPSANHVWGKYLSEHNYECVNVDGEPVRYVSEQLQKGTFILATGSHVVTVIDGDYYDAWDSGDERVTCIWKERS